jgi:hypothetical protein
MVVMETSVAIQSVTIGRLAAEEVQEQWVKTEQVLYMFE